MPVLGGENSEGVSGMPDRVYYRKLRKYFANIPFIVTIRNQSLLEHTALQAETARRLEEAEEAEKDEE